MKIPTICIIPFILIYFCISAGHGMAADRAIRVVAEPDTTDKRIALVIGNGAYEGSPLANPVTDARVMAKILGQLGFEVIEKENLTMPLMIESIQNFGKKLRQSGVGLFYFAGHGLQVNGENYLIPVKSGIEFEEQVKYKAVNLGEVLAEMEIAKNNLNIIILDACRNNPLKRGFRSAAQGLAYVNAPSGTLIAYATAPGSVAKDGEGKNGVYTGELIRNMQIPDLKIEDVFKKTRKSLQELTNNQQVPWESSSLTGDFYFRPAQTKNSGKAIDISERGSEQTPPAAAPLAQESANDRKMQSQYAAIVPAPEKPDFNKIVAKNADASLTSDDIKLLLGKWVGKWEYGHSITQRKSFDVELLLEADSEGTILLTWHRYREGQAENHARSLKVTKRLGVVSVSFPASTGGEIEFRLKDGKLVGGNVSSKYKNECTLAKVPD